MLRRRSRSSSVVAARSCSSRTTHRRSSVCAIAQSSSARGSSSSTGRHGRRSRTTGGSSPKSAARTSSRPDCGSGAAARPPSVGRGCSTARATSAGSTPPASPSSSSSSSARSPESRPPLLSLELRDDDGVVLAGLTQPTAELGWSGKAGEHTLRFELDRLPLAEGRFHLRAALVGADGERLLHTLDDAASFFVFPPGGESGAVLLSGRWSMEEIAPAAPIGRR